MKMFSLEERKKNTQKIIEYGEYLLTPIPQQLSIIDKKTNNKKIINGYILVLFHWLLTGIPLVYLMIGKINMYFYLSAAVWISIFIFHFYFKGCIITRIERKLWNEKKWWGPWMFLFTPLEKMGICMTDNLANIIFNCWGSSILILILYRIIYK